MEPHLILPEASLIQSGLPPTRQRFGVMLARHDFVLFYSNPSGKFKPFQYKTEPLMVSALFPFIAPAAICWCAFTLSCTFRYNVVGSFFPLTSNVLTGACFIHTDSPSKQTDKYPSSRNQYCLKNSHVSIHKSPSISLRSTLTSASKVVAADGGLPNAPRQMVHLCSEAFHSVQPLSV
ncbi:unnamed protein product [Trypanosoma congolense IL3000]|uniref:WGS project CAEQ00000000 data, annotated contig 187 n=1 Tax=Trypanosoma congolense (strain IL3000) TaxID=1068625 RepID=F9W9L1_TRYCI|nr:unnamed protein product [Trypanosoma congolense IL3000]